MIFGNNMTALGASNIPMAEGYDCSFGPSLALVESARNDFAMFKAMLQSDFREASIMKESATSYVQEAEVTALHEAVGGGIFKKIAELLNKLIAKLKALFTNLIARFRGLYMKDKDLVNKYNATIVKKGVTKVNNVEVKWRKVKVKPVDALSSVVSISEKADILTGLNEKIKSWDTNKETWEKIEKVLKDSGDKAIDSASSDDEYVTNFIDMCLDDEETGKLKDFGVSYVDVAAFLKGYSKDLNDAKSKQTKAENALNKAVNELQKDALNKSSDLIRDKKDDNGNAVTSQEDVDLAQKKYDYAQSLQAAVLLAFRAASKVMTIEYKQNKAAFMKCVTANVDKLDESAIYLDAVAEAAEQEVEDVIDAAMTNEEISKISAASTDITDGMEAKCGNALAHGIDDSCCTRPTEKAKADGEIDTNIDSKMELAYFGQLLW